MREEPVASTPFGTLLRLRKDMDVAQPRVLVVAPLSGHFATLLRSLVRTMLPEHDVCITDWHNARDVSIDARPVRLRRLRRAPDPTGWRRWARRTHVVAVCQPCVQVLAAAAVMAQAGSPAQPRSMTLMAGPIDTRVNPTKVNELAMSKPIEWFEHNLIARVPMRYGGAGRAGLSGLRAARRLHVDEHRPPPQGAPRPVREPGQAATSRRRRSPRPSTTSISPCSTSPPSSTSRPCSGCSRRRAWPRASSTFRGEPVEPAAIRRTALLTVEGERDDICALGQTSAAHDLCTGLKPYMKRHHMQAGVGHYGVFSGKRWEEQVYPIVRNMILASE